MPMRMIAKDVSRLPPFGKVENYVLLIRTKEIILQKL